MKREILFRGKRVDTGEWVEGNLITARNGAKYIIPSEVFEPDGHHLIIDSDEAWRVNTETAGQCIGISDKHGIEIFEDDIVKYFEPHSKTWHTRIVRWDWRFAGFGLFDKESEWCKESDWLKIKDIEVIGNIHDNKELIK